MTDAIRAGSGRPSGVLIGVLALQGDFEAHGHVLERLGAGVREVRVVDDLDGIAGLIIPGGESTTITLGIAREGLAEPIEALVARGLPVFGSCAGLIMLDRAHLGLMDMLAERNAFGRQIKSFEADVEVAGLAGGPLHGVFIRAPWIAEHGPQVELLAEIDGHAVAAQQGSTLAVAFHTELGDDDRLHELLLDWARTFADERSA
ncbi:MAG TPA: pyridoxal 5'-phosphate synthase glutaminase subunit PdxT [Solirubrobacteraceae bacterium]|nr:pyridoxal 5'-phosphate synthase glutaminase subunit PdxT [Solirubrobacteraceae bacterium]